MTARKLATANRRTPASPQSDAIPVIKPALRRAIELIGERWALLILAVLITGPRRFSHLKQELAGISANVLTTRLDELEERGLVRRRHLPKPASVQVYEATDWALEAAPFIQLIEAWASRESGRDQRTYWRS